MKHKPKPTPKGQMPMDPMMGQMPMSGAKAPPKKPGKSGKKK